MKVPISAVLLLAAAGCAGGDEPLGSDSSASASPGTSAASDEVDEVVTIDDGRKLYIHCSGSGSPTVVLEGGDDDTSDSYDYAFGDLAAVTRTCAYDRANLGRSEPDPRCRGLSELVSDLEQVLTVADVADPYVLVGTSGGGHIIAGYAADHASQIAGMVLVEVPPPFPDPPADLVAETRCDAAGNIESRNYLQVERDAWDVRQQVGDIPVTVISNRYRPDEVTQAPPFERPLLRDNVKRQRGWLRLSPQAEQVVVHTGHAVEEADPQLVIDAILDVVDEARG